MIKLHNEPNSGFYFVGGQELSVEIVMQFLNQWVINYPYDQITDITAQTEEAVVFDVITKENMYETLMRSRVVWSNLFREGHTDLKDCPLSVNSTLVLHKCRMTA